MSEDETNTTDQNAELLRLIEGNKARLAKLQRTIKELQKRTEAQVGSLKAKRDGES